MSEPPASPLSLKPAADGWNSMSLSRLTFTGKDIGISKTLAALGVLGLISMLLGGLSVLLLFCLSYRQDNPPSEADASTRVGGVGWSVHFIDSSVVLGSLCIMLCSCSLVSSSAQCYFAAKMLKLPQGEERYNTFMAQFWLIDWLIFISLNEFVGWWKQNDDVGISRIFYFNFF